MAALVFFALVCLLIIKRRIIDRGIRAASLFGRAAEGAGGVGRKGVKAFMPSELKTALGDTLKTEASTVLASAATIAASISSISASARSKQLLNIDATNIPAPSSASDKTPTDSSGLSASAVERSSTHHPAQVTCQPTPVPPSDPTSALYIVEEPVDGADTALDAGDDAYEEEVGDVEEEDEHEPELEEPTLSPSESTSDSLEDDWQVVHDEL